MNNVGGWREETRDWSDEILEFDPISGQWEMLDQMFIVRRLHAVSVINFDPSLCNEI